MQAIAESNSLEFTKNISEEIQEIELTPEEHELAILEAKEKKFYKIRNKEYAEKVRRGYEWKIPKARELYEELKKTKSKSGLCYKVNANNQKVIAILCLYFANDPKLETEFPGMKLSKGICLTGKQGTGKTHLMNFFAKNPKASYLITTCRDVAEKFRTNWEYEGINTLEYYSSQPKASQPQAYNHEVLGFCFGDLGTEEDKNNYGNKMNVLDEIFFKRYETGVPLHMTHFTTNLSGEEIKERYGVRFHDRLKETCNWIVLNGESFRE